MSGKKFLIGVDKENNFIYIEDFTWDCDWYWGGGYIEIGSLTNLEELRLRAEDDDIEDIWKMSVREGNYIGSLRDFEEEWKDSFEERIDEIERLDDKHIIEWHTHTHFDGELANKDFKDIFKITKFDEDSFRDLRILFSKFYSLRKVAEYYHQRDKRLNKKLNKEIETQIIPQIRKLLEKNQLQLLESIKKLESD